MTYLIWFNRKIHKSTKNERNHYVGCSKRKKLKRKHGFLGSAGGGNRGGWGYHTFYMTNGWRSDERAHDSSVCSGIPPHISAESLKKICTLLIPKDSCSCVTRFIPSNGAKGHQLNTPFIKRHDLEAKCVTVTNKHAGYSFKQIQKSLFTSSTWKIINTSRWELEHSVEIAQREAPDAASLLKNRRLENWVKPWQGDSWETRFCWIKIRKDFTGNSLLSGKRRWKSTPESDSCRNMLSNNM